MPPRKTLARREPNGQTKRSLRESAGPSPTEISRLRDAALAGMKDPIWGTQLGILHLSGKLTNAQLAAGKRWAELARDYSTAQQSPKPPRSAALEASAGSAADPDSAKGAREARRHSQIVHGYLGALEALKRTGEIPRLAVRDVCEFNLFPVGSFQLAALRTGLQGLAAWWAGEKK